MGPENYYFYLFILSSLLSGTFSAQTLLGQDTQQASTYSSWGIDPNLTEGTINLQPALKTFREKKTVVVAVIDTGIDFQHPFLKNNIHTVQGTASAANYGMDFSQTKGAPKTTPEDDHGHGTHVSGIIRSIFPQVRILPLKYFNPNASGQENLAATIKALEYAVAANVDIINYSGGGPEASMEELKILKIAEQKGILVVAAAGNEHSDIDQSKNAYYPASYRLNNIITVTAHNQGQEVLPSSNWGAKSVDISAPGYQIRSSIPHYRAGTMTGTSQATAFVTGVAALLKAHNPSLDAYSIRKVLIAGARKIPTLKGKCLAEGILNAGGAFEEIGKVAARLRKNTSPLVLAMAGTHD